MLTGQELLETICAELQEIGMKQMAGKLNVMYRSDDFLTMDHLTLLADLIEPEYNEKITKRVKTRLKNANLLGCPYELGDCANSNEREYFPAGITESLSSLNFVEEGLNVCILGPSDSGKTYLAKALGVKACQDYRVAYCHCESLIEDLAYLKTDDFKKYRTQMKHLVKLDMLILDDFLLHTISEEREVKVLQDILEFRLQSERSTIFCSQREPKSWVSMILNDEISFNAILKRATKHYTIVINTKETE